LQSRKLPKDDRRPMGQKFGQSGHPGVLSQAPIAEWFVVYDPSLLFINILRPAVWEKQKNVNFKQTKKMKPAPIASATPPSNFAFYFSTTLLLQLRGLSKKTDEGHQVLKLCFNNRYLVVLGQAQALELLVLG
jgi:hypothetical protein